MNMPAVLPPSWMDRHACAVRKQEQTVNGILGDEANKIDGFMAIEALLLNGSVDPKSKVRRKICSNQQQSLLLFLSPTVVDALQMPSRSSRRSRFGWRITQETHD